MILGLLSNWIRKRLHSFRAGFCQQIRHLFNMPSWLLQVEILAFLQAGGVDLVLPSSFNLETEITMEHDVGIEDMGEDRS